MPVEFEQPVAEGLSGKSFPDMREYAFSLEQYEREHAGTEQACGEKSGPNHITIEAHGSQ